MQLNRQQDCSEFPCHWELGSTSNCFKANDQLKKKYCFDAELWEILFLSIELFQKKAVISFFSYFQRITAKRIVETTYGHVYRLKKYCKGQVCNL